MDWDLAITRNREALKRVLALLVAMASAATFTSPLWGGRREASGGGSDIAGTPTRPSDDGRIAGDPNCSAISPAFSADDRAAGSIGGSASKPHQGEVNPARPALPRHLHRAVLRLLRPAESAARRLVIVAARDVVVPPPRLREPLPARRKPSRTGIVFPPGVRSGAGLAARPPRAAPARIALPLFDTLRPPSRRPRRIVAGSVPRISLPGLTAPHPLPPKPMPFDRIDATRVRLRIAALAAVLDDLPAQAMRFARWRARRDAVLRDRASGVRRRVRLSPLRPGRPPGTNRRSADEVQEALRDLQQLAWWALEAPDTS